jgi:hypothetical protein
MDFSQPWHFFFRFVLKVYSHMINRVGKICVAAMSLCMIVLIVTRKRGDGRYYFALSMGYLIPRLVISLSKKQK